jgi:diguanylate cyclase (GGDEF)-like protein
LRGISVYDFAHPDDRDEISKVVFDKLVPAREGTMRLERRLVRADGSTGWVAFAITYVRGIGGSSDYLLAVGEDVTERHRLEEELHRQARHDPLTGLPNRRHLLERIETIVATSNLDDRVGLCFVDLDRFKEINDRYGHGIGDRVLSVAATRLSDSLIGEDCTLARIGGDEFVAVVSPPADNDRVTAVADRLLSALARPLDVGEHRLRVSASIGAVVTTVAGVQPEVLLDAADRELYQAKTRGKDQWVIHIHEPADG